MTDLTEIWYVNNFCYGIFWDVFSSAYILIWQRITLEVIYHKIILLSLNSIDLDMIDWWTKMQTSDTVDTPQSLLLSIFKKYIHIFKYFTIHSIFYLSIFCKLQATRDTNNYWLNWQTVLNQTTPTHAFLKSLISHISLKLVVTHKWYLYIESIYIM